MIKLDIFLCSSCSWDNLNCFPFTLFGLYVLVYISLFNITHFPSFVRVLLISNTATVEKKELQRTKRTTKKNVLLVKIFLSTGT